MSPTESLAASGTRPLRTEVLIVGAGAAGLMCAITAGNRGRAVTVLDHANKIGRKILMSGGGRCNFTNLFTEPENFLSANPHFCKSALSRFTQWDFLALVEKHGIPYHEKKLGQLFCDESSNQIVNLLLDECTEAGARIHSHYVITTVQALPESALPYRYRVSTDSRGHSATLDCESLVVATGGLSIPTMGASGWGYELAKQFDLPLLPTAAGLVPFTLAPEQLTLLKDCIGNAAEVRVSCNGHSFQENMLFTHRGLSGPAMLQISSYWRPGQSITVDLLPGLDLAEHLLQLQLSRPKAMLSTVMAERLTKSLATVLCGLWCDNRPLNQYSHKELQFVAEKFKQWDLVPAGTEGYRTAEVTLGGIDSACLSSKTMEVKTQPGLYFIGEVVDVTGHLGGFNFQWAWASGNAAGLYA